MFWRWRLLTWAIIGFTGVMGVLALIVLVSAGGNCDDAAAAEQDACLVGTGLTVTVAGGIIFCVWFFGFVVLGILWLMFRPARRACPACGRELRQGQARCRCGFDPRSGAVTK